MSSLYLDHAATSHPKAPGVVDAVTRWFHELGVSAGRGDSDRCAEVGRTVRSVRTRLAALCGVAPERLAFTAGATDGLNLALRGLLRGGERVLTTAVEHSSVVRPLVALRDEIGVTVDVLRTPDVDAARAALAEHRYDVFAFSHASNVTGEAFDAAGLCELARAHGCTTIVDASQTAGTLPLDLGADVLVASAHKSLLGPPGLGLLAARSEVALRPWRRGGTGSSTALAQHPEEWPTAMEAGTPNTPAIFGLEAALAWLDAQPPGSLLAHGLALIDALRAELTERGVRFQSPAAGPRVPVLSLTLPELDPIEAGAVLAGAGIHVRTGFHCAPWIHEHLGTGAAGTVRVSPGPFVTEDAIRQVPRILYP